MFEFFYLYRRQRTQSTSSRLPTQRLWYGRIYKSLSRSFMLHTIFPYVGCNTGRAKWSFTLFISHLLTQTNEHQGKMSRHTRVTNNGREGESMTPPTTTALNRTSHMHTTHRHRALDKFHFTLAKPPCPKPKPNIERGKCREYVKA